MAFLTPSRLHLAGYSRGEDSDNSVVDYHRTATMHRGSDYGSVGRRTRPEKIIITVSFSDLIGYPLLRVSQCISVLRFQKSLLDLGADSDGVYRNLLILPSFSIASLGGLGFTKNLVCSIWQRHGLLGFFRGFPEFVIHKLSCDVMNFVVPAYIAPKVEASTLEVYKKVITFEYSSFSHLKAKYASRFAEFSNEHSYICFWENRSFKEFLKRNVRFSPYEFLIRVLVELFTYPVLTVSSKMMIYDGSEKMNGLSLLGSIIREDGIASLYSGFTWQVVALMLQHLEKQHEILKRQMSFTMEDISTPIDQSLPVFLAISNMICQQMSLVHRCGSRTDGFCKVETSLGILSRFSWVNISSQLMLTVALLHLKNKVLEES